MTKQNKNEMPESLQDDDDVTCADLFQEGFVFAPEYVKLEKGDQIKGIYRGEGPDKEVKGNDGMRMVPTILIERAGGRTAMLFANAGLLKELAAANEGDEVVILHKGQETTSKGNRVNTYRVGVKQTK